MPTEQQLLNNTTGSFALEGPVRGGQRLTISNRTVEKLSFMLGKVGAPAGNVTFTIRKVSDDSIINSKVWGDASTLPAVPDWREVTFTTPVLVNEEVRILWEFVQPFNTANQVGWRYQNTDVKAGEKQSHYRSGAWSDFADRDTTYKYTYAGPAAGGKAAPMAAKLVAAGVI